jgi:hypothetical protein
VTPGARCQLCGGGGEVHRSLALDNKIVCARCYQRHTGAPILTDADVPPPAKAEPRRRHWLHDWLDALERRGLPVVPNGMGGHAAAFGSECPLCGDAMRITWTDRTITLACLADEPCDEEDIAIDLGAGAA